MSVFDTRGEVVRVKVKLVQVEKEAVYKKFAVDPHITTFEVLQRHIARAFDLKCDFSISYLATDDYGEQIYLSMLSDWDLDAAFLNSGSPTLRLKIEPRPFDEGLDDWDIIVPGEVPSRSRSAGSAGNGNPPASPSSPTPETGVKSSRSLSTGLPAGANQSSSIFTTISNQMEKTVTSMQKAFQFRPREPLKPKKLPMTDQEFKNYQDSIGKIVQPAEFRQGVFLGGLEASLRKVAWRLILDVFPEGLTGQERLAFLQSRSEAYVLLKGRWQRLLAEGRLSHGHVVLVNNIRRDVMRTDRGLDFYDDATPAGQRHLAQLYDLLCTFAFCHPSVGYVQGMSDMASPLLYVQEDEANAYLCFCGLMRRLAPNFTDDRVVQAKFRHMRQLLAFHDPSLAHYFHQNESHAYIGTMFRWILLELKREFEFEATLRVLEMQWASLAPRHQYGGVRLTGPDFEETWPDAAPASPKESPYLRFCLSGAGPAPAAPSPTAAALARRRRSSLAGEPGSPPAANGTGGRSDGDSLTLPLPPPSQLGQGNPFLIFLCVSLLVEYREPLLGAVNEDSYLSVFFRKLGRRHNVTSVVNRAADLYAAYLREQRGAEEEFPLLEMSL